MTKVQRKALESAAWRVGDLGDFFGLSDAEVQVIDLRISVVDAVKRVRARAGMTQRQLATLLGTSQPRVAKIESPAATDVSLDQLFRALFAVGGTLADLEGLPVEVTGSNASKGNGTATAPQRPAPQPKTTKPRHS